MNNTITFTIKDNKTAQEAVVIIPEELRERFYQIIQCTEGESLEEAAYMLVEIMKEKATQDVVAAFEKVKHQRLTELNENFDNLEVGT